MSALSMAWGVNNSGWWGEGEIKFFLDGDKEFPTICGTGTEDYFCGSYNFENKETKAVPRVLYCVCWPTPDHGVLMECIRAPNSLWHVFTALAHHGSTIRFDEDLRGNHTGSWLAQ